MTTAGRVSLTAAVVFAASLFIVAGARAQPPPVQPILIRDIRVEGNRRVQEAVILGRVKSTVGSTFNPSRLSVDIMALLVLGLFYEVLILVQDIDCDASVEFVLCERPLLIAFG